MIQMSVSDQIIAVLDDLCAKFGLAINWSSENILPYLQDICSRLIHYECFTSIAWCVIAFGVLAIFKFMWSSFDQYHKKAIEQNIYSEYDFLAVLCQIAFWIWLFIGVIIVAVQFFDIIACGTIPEKVIFEYVSELLKE